MTEDEIKREVRDRIERAFLSDLAIYFPIREGYRPRKRKPFDWVAYRRWYDREYRPRASMLLECLIAKYQPHDPFEFPLA